MQALRQWLTHPVTVRLAQLAIGALFIVASLAKLGDLPAFAEQIHNFRSLPLAAENLVAATLPWIELVAGLALVFGVRPRSGAWVVGGLTAVFTVAVIVAWIRGLDRASDDRLELVGTLAGAMEKLGIQPIVEGVEQPEEAEACAELGFELGQGFHFGRPERASTF